MRGFNFSIDKNEENVFISKQGLFIYPIYETFDDYETRPTIHTKLLAHDSEEQTTQHDIFVSEYGVNSMYLAEGTFVYVLL